MNRHRHRAIRPARRAAAAASQVVYRLDNLHAARRPARGPPAATLDRAAAIIESGAYPAVVDTRLMNALLETGCVSHAALAVTREGRPTECCRGSAAPGPTPRPHATPPR